VELVPFPVIFSRLVPLREVHNSFRFAFDHIIQPFMPFASANTQQESLPDIMTFQKTWRVYQSRLLDQLDRYLANKHLHVVAAPGSGKTVLGLEVIRRINQPTLVLAPTLTIRDQWVDRLIELFLPRGSGRPAWISTELRSPGFLTVATYQALHAACSGEPEEQTQQLEADENAGSKNHFDTRSNVEEINHVARPHVPLPNVLAEAEFRARHTTYAPNGGKR